MLSLISLFVDAVAPPVLTLGEIGDVVPPFPFIKLLPIYPEKYPFSTFWEIFVELKRFFCSNKFSFVLLTLVWVGELFSRYIDSLIELVQVI